MLVFLSACDNRNAHEVILDDSGDSPNTTDTAPDTVDQTPDSCDMTLIQPDETGLPSFELSWSALEAHADGMILTTTTAFFGDEEPGVTLMATYDTTHFEPTGFFEDVISLMPAERTDGQSVQEYFRRDGELRVSVTATAHWVNGLRCSDTITAPFRAWGDIDETQTCEGPCTQPDRLFLPTRFHADLSEDVARSMADIAVSNTYFQTGGSDNFTLTQLPLTGTPMQFTRIGADLFNEWDSKNQLGIDTVLNCATWLGGKELVLTQAYPNLSQAVAVVFGAGESVEGFSYTQVSEEALPIDEQTWLHHNCFVDPDTLDDEVVKLYALAWGEAAWGGNVWSSNLVSLSMDSRDGSITSAVDVVVDATLLTNADFKYSNGLTLSPVGTDGIRWMGVSYANDNYQSNMEDERAFFLALPLTGANNEQPRFLFVNEGVFDSSSLVTGWKDDFPQLELVSLPRDPLTGFYPVDFPHSMEFFQIHAGAAGDSDIYRLIIASLGSSTSDNETDGTAEVYMYDITIDDDGAHASMFCATSLPASTNSHFDFVLPGDAQDGRGFSWVGAYTANPIGALYWLDLWQTDPDQRCRYQGAQEPEDQSNQFSFAYPVWSTEIEAVRLVDPDISSVEVRYNAAVLAPSLL